MNIEQIEAQLAEFDGKLISVALPIRGTICQFFYGNLKIIHDWDNTRIIYSVKFYPDTEITFQAQDVYQITTTPSKVLSATVSLKSDSWLEQSRLTNVI